MTKPQQCLDGLEIDNLDVYKAYRYSISDPINPKANITDSFIIPLEGKEDKRDVVVSVSNAMVEDNDINFAANCDMTQVKPYLIFANYLAPKLKNVVSNYTCGSIITVKSY